jgi:hypothetical protein
MQSSNVEHCRPPPLTGAIHTPIALGASEPGLGGGERDQVDAVDRVRGEEPRGALRPGEWRDAGESAPEAGGQLLDRRCGTDRVVDDHLADVVGGRGIERGEHPPAVVGIAEHDDEAGFFGEQLRDRGGQVLFVSTERDRCDDVLATSLLDLADQRAGESSSVRVVEVAHGDGRHPGALGTPGDRDHLERVTRCGPEEEFVVGEGVERQRGRRGGTGDDTGVDSHDGGQL